MRNEELHISIHDAAEPEAAEILELQRAAFHPQAVLYNDFSLPPLVQTLDELTRDFSRYTFLKASCNGKIVGSVRGRAEGDTCHVSRLMVHPDYQNRGIGKMLMRAVEQKFGAVQRYELFTGHKSDKNLALYRSLGYREYDRKPQSAAVMLVCMEKRKPGRQLIRSGGSMNIPVDKNRSWMARVYDGIDRLAESVKAGILQPAGEACAGDILLLCEKYLGRKIKTAHDLITGWNLMREDRKLTGRWEAQGNVIRGIFNECGCPLVRSGLIELRPAHCYCSQSMMETIFSRVSKKPVQATIKRSIGRGDEVCDFEIALQL